MEKIIEDKKEKGSQEGTVGSAANIIEYRS